MYPPQLAKSIGLVKIDSDSLFYYDNDGVEILLLGTVEYPGDLISLSYFMLLSLISLS